MLSLIGLVFKHSMLIFSAFLVFFGYISLFSFGLSFLNYIYIASCLFSYASFFFLLLLLYLYEKVGVSLTYCGNHFTIYINQTIMLYTLNLHHDVRKLFLNKTGKSCEKQNLKTFRKKKEWMSLIVHSSLDPNI